MAATQCRDITEWVEEQVSKPVEEWEQRQEQRCKKESCNWWTLCLNKLLCWFVTIFVKVVRWVVVTIGKWVTRTVCTVVGIVVDLVVAVATGLFNIVAGILTWDWARVWDGFVTLVGGLATGILGLARVAFLIDTIDYIREEIQKYRLRNYVRDLLEKRFARDPDNLTAALEAIGVDHGAFGLRLTGRASRTFVRSDRMSDTGDGVPELIRWHENPNLDIDIRKLAGYDYDSFWKRGRPEVVGADQSEVNEYIARRGGKAFRIYPMSEGVLRHKASVCEERARELGLIYEFEFDEREIRDPAYVLLAESRQDEYNVDVLRRIDESVDASGARDQDLPAPHGGTVFGYQGTLVGLSAHLDDAVGVDGSPFPGSNTSGVSCLDRVPDLVFEYVFAHELGHYFGLVHVDGAHRIMFTMNKSQGKSVFTWWTVPSLLVFEQQPKFVLEEAKRVWDYIVAGWPTKALTTRAHS